VPLPSAMVAKKETNGLAVPARPGPSPGTNDVGHQFPMKQRFARGCQNPGDTGGPPLLPIRPPEWLRRGPQQRLFRHRGDGSYRPFKSEIGNRCHPRLGILFSWLLTRVPGVRHPFRAWECELIDEQSLLMRLIDTLGSNRVEIEVPVEELLDGFPALRSGLSTRSDGF
jgi:hypothetical protein